MTMTIGRVAINDDPYDIRVSNEAVSFSFMLGATSLTDGLAKIQQLVTLGAVNIDEPIIPVTWTEDPSFDGYYSVDTINVVPVSAYLNSGESECSITLRKLPSFSYASVECIIINALRTNSLGVTAPTTGMQTGWLDNADGSGPQFNIPYDVLTIGAGTQLGGIGIASGVSDTIRTAFASSLPNVNKTLNSFLPAKHYYKGMARLELKYGSTWYPMHGRMLPRNLAGGWRITNDYLRVTPADVGGGVTGLLVEKWDVPAQLWRGKTIAQWDGAGLLAGLTGSIGATGSYRDPVVIVNTPEIVALKVPNNASSTNTSGWTFVLRSAQGYIEMWSPVSTSGGIGLGTAEAGTAYTGGIRATVSDANGMRYWICGLGAAGLSDLVNGRYSTTGSPYLAFTPDYQTNLAAAGAGGLPTDLRDQFCVSRAERRRVVVA